MALSPDEAIPAYEASKQDDPYQVYYRIRRDFCLRHSTIRDHIMAWHYLSQMTHASLPPLVLLKNYVVGAALYLTIMNLEQSFFDQVAQLEQPSLQDYVIQRGYYFLLVDRNELINHRIREIRRFILAVDHWGSRSIAEAIEEQRKNIVWTGDKAQLKEDGKTGIEWAYNELTRS